MCNSSGSSPSSLPVARRESAQPQVTFSPPRFLQPLPQFGVLICTTCRSSYVARNQQRHLRDVHHYKGATQKALQEWLADKDIVEEESQVRYPANGGAPITGLPVHSGWVCNVGACDYLTSSTQKIGRHCRKEHDRSVRKNPGVCSQVQLQTFFAKNPKYFIVVPTEHQYSSPRRPLPATPTSRTSNSHDHEDAWSSISQRFHHAQEQHRTRYAQLQEPEHVSEVTPWLKVTDFHNHVLGLNFSDFAASLEVPKTAEQDGHLFHVCQSVDRVLRRGLRKLRGDAGGNKLSSLDARLLNSFQAGTTSQDPFEHHQDRRSITSYSRTFQKAVCYFFRVRDGHFERDLFQVTDVQKVCADEVTSQVADLCCILEEDDEEEDEEEQEEKVDAAEKHLDQRVLALCVALVKHRLLGSRFDSALLSLCAVLAWDTAEGSWMKPNDFSPRLSHLIYDIQLILLLNAFDLVEQNVYAELGDAINHLPSTWLANDTRGPVCELSTIRLYAMAFGASAVNPARIRWYRDNETLVYNDITYKVSFLRDETDCYLEHAREVFHRDLCLGLSGVPVYHIHELQDNWDARRPGYSFVDDVRNADILSGGSDWLIENIRQDPSATALLFQADSSGEWQVRSSFAEQYEASVQRFLEYMLVLLHKGSGQPARKPEFLGTRWQNCSYDKRNLFIHEGYLLFILTYHKSLSRIHASRFPVRFLLPEVGELLVQYLVLVQPLRRFLRHEVCIPAQITEYLWSHGEGIWTENKMTNVMKRMSRLSIGVPVHVQAWRQIAVGIAVKRFAGTGYGGDFDLPGDADDDNQGRPIWSGDGAMPDVFHYQATHGVRTGNAMYGGTVNFQAGLTDAGLQQYLVASQMWHRLCRPPRPPAASKTPAHGLFSGSKHRRSASSLDTPLPKRLALRQTPLRHHRRWGVESVLATLRTLYPGNAPSFRSPAQAKAIECIVAGHAEVVAILATGEGKSLTFMLPSCLPHAGTTVVILPLVALRQDMMRRCAELRVQYAVWDRQHEDRRFVGCPLLFVTVESAVSSRFRSFLGKLDATQGLDRVVFDESHLALTASPYRPKLGLLKYLRNLRCQFVFLTATLPPLMMKAFQTKLLLLQPSIIRSTTFRHDLFYFVKRANPRLSFLDYMVTGIRRTLEEISPDPQARAIVYTITRPEADELAALLSCRVYYSDSGDVNEKAEVLSQWVQGRVKVVVATSAFGTGVDYPHVRAVIHMGAPKEAISFAQEVGRLGRDGCGGTSRIIVGHDWQPLDSSLATFTLLPLEQQVMHTYLSQPRCRAAVLSRFLDGQSWYCQAAEPEHRCDMCFFHGRFDTARESEAVPEWERRISRAAGVGSGQGTREQTQVEEEEEVEDEEDDDHEEAECLRGGEVLRQHIRDQERGRERYIGRLCALRGCCMICRLLGPCGRVKGSSEEAVWHGLDQCRNWRKHDFFRAKKRAIEEGRRRGGWVRNYVACFGCGNPQDVCERQGKEGVSTKIRCFPRNGRSFTWTIGLGGP